MNKELDPECTFQPKLNAYTFRNSRQTEPIHERSLIWQQRREEKLALTREINETKDLVECSFRPSLVIFVKNRF